MGWMNHPIDRRRFLERGAAALACLSPLSLGVLEVACRRQTVGGAASAPAIPYRSLASKLRGEVILPGDVSYESARRVWNLAVDRHPGAIVRCADVEDVVRAVEFARTQGVVVAVRSGGHGFAGYSVCEGGMVIDLAAMNRVQIDSEKLVAHVSGGARVGELLTQTQPLGLATPTGGCPDIGLGGLTLGGGENGLMAKYGMVCDSVISAQVVTADGRILTASSEENPDLYWAIRGGGGNFGIVTSLDYRLYSLSQVLEGTLLFPISRTRDVLLRYRDLMSDAPDELETSGGLLSLAQGPSLFISICHCGQTAEGERLAASWRSALDPISDDVKPRPYSAEFVFPGSKMAATGSFLPELSDALVDVLSEQFAAAPPSSTAMWNDYHGAVTRVPVDAAAFPLRERGYSLSLTSPWESAVERSASMRWVSGFRESVRPFSRGVYVNNLGDEAEDRAREVYGANYERLAVLKSKYDPNNFYRLNYNIEPAA